MRGHITIAGGFDLITSSEVIGNEFSTLIESKTRDKI